jgi:mono/diheme cytochrome c family protein
VLSPFERQKAAALFRNRYPCLGCHELDGTGGRIGPSLTGLKARRSPAFVVAMITDPQHTVPGTLMPRVPMPAETAQLLASFLAGGSPVDAPPPRSATGGAAGATGLSGEALYRRSCAACHGDAGGGDGPNARFLPVRPTPHASAAITGTRPDDALFDTIFSGGYIMNRSPFMPPFGETLSRDQIWSLVRHIRSLCRCEGPAWSRDPKIQ